jgi:uncharacterized membrane protein
MITMVFFLVGVSIVILAYYLKNKYQQTAYCVGAIVTINVLSLVEDAMGKERYLKFVSEHWATSTYTVPTAVFLLVVAVFVMHCLNHREDHKE